jgi:serine/threonine-protein kinase
MLVRQLLQAAVLAAALINVQPQTAQAASSIAVSPSTGAYGYAYGLPTTAQARDHALQECARQASDCREMSSWEQPGYLAVARGDHGIAVTQGQQSDAAAERVALDGCLQRYQRCTLDRVALDSFGWSFVGAGAPTLPLTAASH